MQCQKCKTNEATINMVMQLNNQKVQMHLCQSCYKELQADMAKGMNMNLDGGAFSEESFQNKNRSHTRTETKQDEKEPSLLDELARNVSHDARNGEIDPVIGRNQEVKRVIETLNRRNKNNPVLIGEPGVGKTAIAEGLALRILESQVPVKLMNKEIYVLDVASLVAGTSMRGQFEERLQQLIQELEERDDVVLFIDEIHLLVGAGTAESSQMDAGNILKPALARGKVQVIGATTLKEYRQIEKDAALERRFQPIIVNEPTETEAIEILEGLKDRYEAFHGVTYTEDIVEAFVTLSSRYIQDRFLPDKAIDLMDEVGSRLNLANAEKDSNSIEQRLHEIVVEKEAAAEAEDYEQAAHLRYQEIQLQKQLEKAQDEKQVIAVELSDVQLLVEEKTGIPVTKLQADEQSKMNALKENLEKNVIGQDQAIDRLSKAIRRSRAGLKQAERPIGSFLFVGPTGVGKTELTKVLAEEMFGTRDAYVRLDMSEYMERHAVSKLIGSPPGYVGHEEAGQLTERVRRHPYSIILLDEIEKAHPDVQNMFLQIMEDGHLTDSQGREVNFKETVIVMTSNAGTGDKEINVGFNADESKEAQDFDKLSAYFKPEFLNRFDSIVTFNNLGEPELLQIVDLMLKDLEDRVKDNNISITITKSAKQALAKQGVSEKFGARPLRRLIQTEVEDALTDLILAEETVEKVLVDVEEDQIVVTKA